MITKKFLRRYILITSLVIFSTNGCYKLENPLEELISLRKDKILEKGGLIAACSYADFLSMKQYKANLHCHSTHSDGVDSPEQLSNWYYNHGYNVLCISDHDAFGDQDGGRHSSKMFQNDTIIHDWDGDGFIHKEFLYSSGKEAYVRDYGKPAPPWVVEKWNLEKPGEMIFLNGVESSFGHPHMNVINHPEGRIGRPRSSYSFINTVQASGGIVFLNHMPYWNGDAYRVYNNKYMKFLNGLEVINGAQARDYRWGFKKVGSDIADGLWTGCLDAGMEIWGFGNDDAHNILEDKDFASAGSAWNMIWAKELTRAGIMDAIKAGAFYATCGVIVDSMKITADSITVVSKNAKHIKVIGSGGKLLKSVDDSRLVYVLRGDEIWIRIILWNDSPCYPNDKIKILQMAWLQPIFIEKLLNN